MPRVREEVINSYVALRLESHLGLAALPEVRSSNEAIDITVRHQGVARPVPIRIEAKLGDSPAKRRDAAKQARSRLTTKPRSIAFGLCYPSDLANRMETATAMMAAIDRCTVAFAPVRAVSDDLTWREGSIADLADSLRNADLSRQAVTDTIEYTVQEVAKLLHERGCAARLAAALALPRREEDLRAATLVAALMLSNAALLHHRLRLVPVLGRITKLETILTKVEPEKAPTIIRKAWAEILEEDFRPVFGPALAALDSLTVDEAKESMRWIMESTVAVADELASLRFDHAGPLYHRLLASAKYDGSYYTNHVSAVLLARLALTEESADWSDTNRLTELRIIDPACGTGTLLMAAMHAIRDRHEKAKATADESDLLHLALVEDVLHGLDVNRHGVHLAACNLTLGNPRVDYRRMNLFTMKHGPQADGRTSAGSLEFLATAREDWHITSLAAPLPTMAELEAERAQPGSTGQGSLTGRFDVVIMNPPFTRNDIRNRQYSKKDRKAVQEREKTIAQFLKDRDEAAYNAIRQTSIESFFPPLADVLLKPKGATLASVVPTTALTGASSRPKRVFIAKRFQLETVITSHDPERINFSENTKIHESLMIARRAGDKRQPTRFISLARMPRDTHEAILLSDIINNREPLGEWGTEHSWPWPLVREGDWRAAQFYDVTLAQALHDLEALAGTLLRPVADLCQIGPEGRRIRDAFIKKRKPNSPWTTPILWNHRTEFQMTMNAQPDVLGAPAAGRTAYAATLKERASRLLIVNRLRTNTVRVSACYAVERLLGSAWVPVRPIEEDARFEQALCAWWNSTPGILTLLNDRGKTLDYARFALGTLRSLLVPNPSTVDIEPLVEAFRNTRTRVLTAWPEMEDCPNRRVLDEAAARVLHIDGRTITDWRRRIAQEPIVRGGARAPQPAAPPLIPNDPTGG